MDADGWCKGAISDIVRVIGTECAWLPRMYHTGCSPGRCSSRMPVTTTKAPEDAPWS